MKTSNRDTVRRLVKNGEKYKIEVDSDLHINAGLHYCGCLQRTCIIYTVKNPSIEIKFLHAKH